MRCHFSSDLKRRSGEYQRISVQTEGRAYANVLKQVCGYHTHTQEQQEGHRAPEARERVIGNEVKE